MQVTIFGVTAKGDNVKYSEVCLLAGTWLLVSQNQFGWGLIGLSMILAFARFSIEVNEKKEAQEKISEGAQNLIDTIIGIAGAGTKNDKSGNTFTH